MSTEKATAPLFRYEQDANVAIAHINTAVLTSLDVLDLTDKLRDRMRYHNASSFVLDFKKVEYLDSSCIGALVQLMREVATVHGSIALAGSQSNVKMLFSITRLDVVFMMYDDVRSAVADLRGD